MAYRNQTYVCFDGDEDMHYYRLMQAWKQHEGINFNFYNAHDLNSARDTSTEESIKRQLRERLKNSKVLVVLVGEKTKNLYKFVRWEIEQALGLGMPIIAVNLNGERKLDSERCPPIIKDKLAVHISFNPAIMQYALENWYEQHMILLKKGEIAPSYYPAMIYK
jgi:DNA-binding protein Fis